MVITPVLCKVPAHSNWKYNEEADVLVKSSATDNQKLNEDLYLNPKLRLLYKEEKIAGKYARDVIKKNTQKKLMKESNDSIQKKWPDVSIDFDFTIALTNNGMKNMNALDAQSTNERKFRVNTINKTLATLIS